MLENSFSRLKQRLAAPPPGDVVEDLAHVEACLRQSQRFLEDLVELGRSGSVRLEPRAVDLAQVVDEVLFEQRELLDQRGVELIVEPGLPTVWCNEGRLKQIVVNLLRNAVKHGCDRQSPRVTIGTVPAVVATTAESGTTPPGNGFRIHDNGRGIEARYHQEIFLPGRRLAGADMEGSGMGLAIVKKVVDHYGGSVYVDPTCTAGTALVVALPPGPLAAENSSPAAAVAAPHRPHAPPPPKKFARRSSAARQR